MNESTQISYGSGTITIEVSSVSTSEVAASDVRFGDYNDVVTACFTEKELETVSEGANATLDFDFIMSDDIAAEEANKALDAEIKAGEQKYGKMEKGVCYEMTLNKAIGDEQFSEVRDLYDEIELLYEIPLYLKDSGRYYYVVTYNRGKSSFFVDSDQEADDLTIKSGEIGTSTMLYQDKEQHIGRFGVEKAG